METVAANDRLSYQRRSVWADIYVLALLVS
jgi:hypothetical protein